MRALVIALSLALGAGESGAEGATESLRARDAEIRAALPPEGATVTSEARKKIEAIVTRTIDLRGMAEAALGGRWQTMSARDRRRLVAAFEARFRRASASELGTYRSTEIEYKPEVAADSLVKVPTKVVVKGEPTEITYSMRRQAAGWRIVDIVVDGVSTVENYRSSFARVISKEGVDGLIRRLERGGTAKRG